MILKCFPIQSAIQSKKNQIATKILKDIGGNYSTKINSRTLGYKRPKYKNKKISRVRNINGHDLGYKLSIHLRIDPLYAHTQVCQVSRRQNGLPLLRGSLIFCNSPINPTGSDHHTTRPDPFIVPELFPFPSHFLGKENARKFFRGLSYFFFFIFCS